MVVCDCCLPYLYYIHSKSLGFEAKLRSVSDMIGEARFYWCVRLLISGVHTVVFCDTGSGGVSGPASCTLS